MKPIPLSRYVLFACLFAGGLAADLASKAWIFQRLGMPGQRPAISLVGQMLTLETHLNEGALFGIGQGRRMLFIPMSVAASGMIVFWLFVRQAAHDVLLTGALGSVLAGIWGNLIDRLGIPGLVWNYPAERVGQAVYAVRDWIHFQVPGVFDFPVFNIADSLLVCGAALLMWHAFREGAAPQTASTAERQSVA